MPGRKRRGRAPARRTSAPHAVTHHTSVPTGRAAYVETRRWLLEQHGPVCAYCGVTWPPRTLTLDHVTPRKGQTAYDRRDNLVLACKRCNAAKADKPFLAYILAQKGRAMNLLRYGEHLSHGILDLVRHVAGVTSAPRIVYGPGNDDESPYADAPAPAVRVAPVVTAPANAPVAAAKTPKKKPVKTTVKTSPKAPPKASPKALAKTPAKTSGKKPRRK